MVMPFGNGCMLVGQLPNLRRLIAPLDIWPEMPWLSAPALDPLM
jgi:hypothetical protein